MNKNNSKVYAVLHEKILSDTQKIVAHVISFGPKDPVLAIQHIWKKDKKDEWRPGKMAVMTNELLSEMIEKRVFEQAVKIISENKID